MKKTLNISTTSCAVIGILCTFFIQTRLISQSCPGLSNLTLNVIQPPAPTLNAPPQLCAGANGTISVNQTFVSYDWNTGGSGQSIGITNGGTYTVTVTNSAGCTNTATTTITEVAAPVPSISQNNYTCNGSLTLNAGAGFNSYSWSNGGGNSQTATFNTSGTYTVTVTNAAGCTGTDAFNITIPTPPVVTISGDLAFCTGLNTILTATPGFSTYAWSAGGNSSTITANTGGTYTVTVTDNFGCTDTESATVIAQQSPIPTVANAQICPDATTTLSVSNAPFSSYSWSDGSTNSSTTVTIGTYSVTVTAANGCTGTTSATVSPLPAPSPNISQAIYTCNGLLTLNAGAGFTTYAWSNSSGNQTTIVNTSGDYTVTVTNAQGCTGTDTYSANIPPPPAVDIQGDNTFCEGLAANLVASPGLITYQWSSGQNGASINVSTAGTYTVTATDAFGCTATNNFTVSQLPAPQPVITGTQIICEGATSTFNTTNSFNAYSWSTGESNPSIIVNTAGTYTVTVTAVNGCTGTDTQTLNVTPAPNPSIFESTYTCNGQLTLNAGGGFSTYSWSNSSVTPSITVNASDTYLVTVTNAQGCTGTDIYDASIPNPPSVSISGDNTLCTGTSTVLSASAGLVSYLWNTGQNVEDITINSSGTYTVTATDLYGCTATSNFTVNALPPPQPVVLGPNSICEGLFATFNTSSNFSTYSWSNGDNTPAIVVDAGGTYTVTVTAANGCTGTDTQVLNVIPAPNPNITEGLYNCNDQLSITAGAGFPSYSWSTGSNAPTIVVTSSDDYTVTVTNTQGCTGTETYFANIPLPPVVDITGNNTICPGSSTTLNSTPDFVDYLWSTSSNSPSISVSAPGNYSVTVTDAYGCTATNEYSVSILTPPTPNISGPAQICPTGSATFSVPGTFTAFLWSTGDVTPTILVNVANTYTVTVTDANGCTGIDSQILTIGNNLLPQITALPYTCNGQITLDAGSGFVSYNWSGGQNAQNITVNTNDDYTVTVSDANGCTGTAIATVTLPPAPSVNITAANNICEGTSTTLHATTGLISYLWNTGQVGDTISVSTAGTYTVTATDALGCTATGDFLLTTAPAPQPTITGPTVICTNATGMLSLGGTFAQYNWSTGDNTPSITISSGNTYTVTVTDAAGCTGTDTQVVTAVTGLSPSLTQLPYTCTGAQTIDAGAGFSAYIWSNGQNTPAISVNAPGNYSVTVTDATGCTGTSALSISIPPAPQVAISGQNSFCQNGNTTLQATAGFISYSWNNGQLTDVVTVNQSGTFTVTVTDNLGCTDTESITVTTLPLPLPQIVGTTAVCAGNNTTFSLGQTYTSYAWSDGTSGASITTNVAGAYTVTITDANGCTGADDAVLSLLQNPLPVITESMYACDGQMTLSADAGFNMYSWAGPNGFTAGIQQPNVTATGTYTVTVTDANGCVGTATQFTTVPPLSQVSINGPTQFCTGSNVTLVASAGFSSYAWSDGATLPNTIANVAGVYTVTATDALGCTSTMTATVGLFPQPTPQIAGPQSVCLGSSATLSMNGTFTNFLWSTGATTNSISVQPPFTGSVTVTDANGCTGTASASVTLANQLSPNIIQLPYTCNGQITLDAGAGFNYAWAGPNGFSSTNQQPTVSLSGLYTVTVSDGTGCSGTASIPVNIPVLQSVTIDGLAQICIGQSTLLTASTGFVSYNWSNGDNTASISVSQPGTYVVSVTDTYGCTGTADIVVNLTSSLSTNITTQPYNCNGQISLTAGAGFSSYSWSNSGNTQAINVIQSGTYTVTVTNASGCTGTATVQAVIPANPVASITGSLNFCTGSSTILTASAGFAAYSWSNGSSLPTASINASGAYVVTVTDGNGCTATAASQVQSLPNPTLAITGGGTICDGSSETLVASGSTGTFVWSNGTNGALLTVTQSGTYSVTVTDLNGCTATNSSLLTVAPPAATTINNSSCRLQEVGTETLLLNTVNGCDSIVTIITTYEPTKPGLALDLEPVIEATIGELVTIDVTGNFSIDSVAFESAFTLSCNNCLAPTLTATESGFIQVAAYDPDGCRTMGEVQVLVNKDVRIYVPNVFQPGSPLNGFFSVFSGPEIKSVRNFNVFDRWGNLMFSRKDMPTNDPTAGWDGSFRNQPMQPGVYVYYFEVLLADGSTKFFSGDVTIVQ